MTTTDQTSSSGFAVHCEETKGLAGLRHLIDLVAGAEDLGSILEVALDELTQRFSAIRATVALDDHDRVTRFKAWHGPSDDFSDLARGYSPWSPAASHFEPVLITNVRGDPGLRDMSQTLIDQGIDAIAFFPLVDQGARLGRLTLYFDKPHEFKPDDVEFGQAIAGEVAIAIGRKLTEDRLKLYSSVVKHSINAIAILDLNGVYREQNEAHRELLGFSDAELAGNTPALHLGESLFQRVHAEIAERGTFRGELKTLRADGQEIDIELAAFSISDSDGRPLCYVGIKRDIGERKRAQAEIEFAKAELEDRIRERTAALEAANHEMEGFTYSVSHDLRAPLRAVMATSRMLLEECSERLHPEEIALLERQAHNAKKLATLIDDLLKLSRLSREKMTPAEIDLSALAEEIAHEIDSNDRIVVEPGIRAKADPKLIRLVIQNLFDNAIKFSPNGGDVVFGQREDAIFVSDQGIGFDMAYVSKLFLPFERFVRDADFPGTGIGLANVKRIIDRHGGKVWAESELGKGTTIWFSLD